MGFGYNKEVLSANYRMFCASVDDCLLKLRIPDISEADRGILERRVRVTFMMTDYSLSALEECEDSFLNEVREGVDERRVEWGHYRSSNFRASAKHIDKAYNLAWKELE